MGHHRVAGPGDRVGGLQVVDRLTQHRDVVAVDLNPRGYSKIAGQRHTAISQQGVLRAVDAGRGIGLFFSRVELRHVSYGM